MVYDNCSTGCTCLATDGPISLTLVLSRVCFPFHPFSRGNVFSLSGKPHRAEKNDRNWLRIIINKPRGQHFCYIMKRVFSYPLLFVCKLEVVIQIFFYNLYTVPILLIQYSIAFLCYNNSNRRWK